MCIAWWDINPRDWISESAQIRDTLYPTAADLPKEPAEGQGSRQFRNCPTLTSTSSRRSMERRLQQAGVRLAAYLNDVFASPKPVPGPPSA